MGRLGCSCGTVMSSVDCPSEDILHIYSEEEISRALSEAPAITLWDFRAKDRPFEYWHCSRCGRVHEVDFRRGQCVRRYRPDPQTLSPHGIPADWQALCVITDIELDAATEADFHLRLADALPLIPRRALLSPDQKHAIVLDCATGTAKIWFVEDMPAESSSPELHRNAIP